jgi:ubiquinone/menaquinone biosynthesis C-methylase UbiE
MPTEHEAARVRTVYREYMPHVASRWDPANRGNGAILAELEQGIRDLLERRGLLPLGDRRVLDVGCGYGHFLGFARRLGAKPKNLHGVDLMDERIAVARAAQPDADLRVANAEALPYPDDSFDVVLLFSVLTSILDPGVRLRVGHEVARVLAEAGVILWYDFRFDHPSNPNVRGVGRAEIARVFPGFSASLETMTLVPPLARRLGRLTPVLYPALASLPVLRSHYFGILERRRRM